MSNRNMKKSHNKLEFNINKRIKYSNNKFNNKQFNNQYNSLCNINNRTNNSTNNNINNSNLINKYIKINYKICNK